MDMNMDNAKINRRIACIVIMSLAMLVVAAQIPSSGMTAHAAGATAPDMIPRNFTTLAQAAGPAVVNISTERTINGGGRVYEHFFNAPRGPNDPFQNFFDRFFQNMPQRDFKQKSLGSGFILDNDGYIVTNNHVIDGADQIQVKLKNGKEYPAEIIGKDTSTDIALIRIKADHELPSLKLGDSGKLEIGQWVLAIGNPFGLEHTVTAGIVSAKGRVIGAGPYDDFIQTDASINPGNSGGPLLNLNGEVVGINTAIIAGGAGIGFAIPADMAKTVIEQLRKNGAVTRGWLGVAIQDLNADLTQYYGLDHGALVTEVFPGDPADKAGIRPNDIIVSLNGENIESGRDLSKKISDLGVGEKAKIGVYREGKAKTVTVEIAKRVEKGPYDKTPGDEPGEPGMLGMALSDITPEIAERLNIEPKQGVIVVGITPGGKADKAGVRQNDVIFEINHQPIRTVADCRKMFENADEGEKIQLLMKRPGSGLVVATLAK